MNERRFRQLNILTIIAVAVGIGMMLFFAFVVSDGGNQKISFRTPKKLDDTWVLYRQGESDEQIIDLPTKLKAKKGEIITLSSVDTIADGIKVKTPGDLTFDMCRQYVDEVVTVTESEIASAILTVLEKQKLVAEGAGAVGIAAAMYGKVDLRGKTVCALLSGGNVDVTMLERIITRGLAKAGRTANFATVLPDQPKTLATLLNIMSDMGVNVLEVNHERGNLKAPVGSCVVHLLVETRDALHVQQIYETLRAQGYPIMER